SVQSGGVPGTHVPGTLQVSTPLQNALSLQSALVRHWTHWSVCSLHRSGHGSSPGLQPWVGSQTSIPVQNWPSSHPLFCGRLSQRSRASLHESGVQVMSSLQFGAVPGWQPRIALHVSVPSQNCPLLQLASLVTWLHESVSSLQESAVQLTLSLQLGGVPG